MYKLRETLFLSAILAPTFMVVHAAEEEKTEKVYVPQEIVVTGEKQGYVAIKSAGLKTDIPLLDTPQTVSVITNEQILDQAFQDVGDILRYTPGVSVNQGEGHRDQISIRGQNTTADFFLDGVRDDVQYFRPLYNLDRVEVHKGPNALIFGRGGGGGNINRVTKTPFAGDRFVNMNSSVDSFGAYQVMIDGNRDVGDDSAVRLNVLAEGFNNHRDFFDGERYAFNPTYATNLTNDTTIQLSYEYINDDRVVDRGVPAVAGGVFGNPASPVSGFTDTFFGSPSANETTLDAHILRGRIFHDFNEDHQVNATIQYANFDKLYQNLFAVGSNLAANSVTLDGYRDETDRENLIMQLNFLSDITTGPFKHKLLYGAEYANQKTDNNRRDSLFAASNDDQVTFAFTDPLNIPAFTFPVFNRNRTSEADIYSLYFQDQISIGEHFQLIGGLRLDRFDIDVVDQIEINDGAADGNDGFLGRTDTELSPRLGAIYKPIENVSFYASYSLSFLPRSGDQFLTLSSTTESLAPEEFENYEVGAKWDITRGLSFTTSFFRLNRTNGTTVDPTNVGNTLLIGSRTDGIELQLLGQVNDKWQINTGYSFLDAKERRERTVSGVTAVRTLSQVPEHLFSIWNRYDFTPNFGLGLGVVHQSQQFTSISNAVELPNFTRVDAAAYYRVNNKINVQLNVENLFDRDYFPAAHNDNNITTGEPINARLSFNIDF